MWKNIWPLLLVGGLAYVYYTGFNPLRGMMPASTHPPGMQAGGAAPVREIQRVPQAIHEIPDVSRSAAGTAQAARDVVQKTLGGGH
jgi:hypothetical protein